MKSCVDEGTVNKSNAYQSIPSDSFNRSTKNNSLIPKAQTAPADSTNSSFNFIPSGFFQGLALQLPFKRRNRSKRNENSSLNVYPASNNFSDENNEWEHIELVQFSNQVVIDSGNETGTGHGFCSLHLKYPTWCDRCGDFIWGVSKVSVRCKNCNYTCHEKCKDLVTLDCKVLSDTDGNSSFTESTSSEKDSFELNSDISSDEEQFHEAFFDAYATQEIKNEIQENHTDDIAQTSIVQKLELFNRNQTQGLHMTMYDDGSTFRGFIRVHMNLSRPINVVAGTRPPSIYDIIYDEEESMRKTLTSFYLPRDTIKALHVTSATTTQEVIISLLKKFKVVDNPLKFALYESFIDPETDQIKMRRLPDHEQPLLMALKWGTEGIENRSFVLQENETGDILWEAFSMPELNNFLRILDREEDEYMNQVKNKYKLLQERIEELITQNKPS
ncbi:Ras association domain-containing protein 1 [Nymphon striatum]|nr:Ras association domain-containing protein 1 [Nymphon striatum]KAG1686086.1 Ras association domain-containing protein 1 [Nymphon striatum]